ncbi:MAG: ATP-binding cassette, subfamily fatty acid transporter [Mycobacterium sp.]|jgi:ATP-binding cassette subfamily B protein|nr:ATP-binding cassette, subfamily fatty acid transporter [Mycobacterium sp.]
MPRALPSKAPGAQNPTEESKDFRGAATRLAERLTPHRWLTAAVIAIGVAGVAVAVIGPRVLGHATDLVFNGVLGRRLPAGITKEQAITAARTRGDNTFADLLSDTSVRPGAGVDFGAVGRTLLLALAIYLFGALLVWGQARLLNITVQRTMMALRTDVEDKVHRMSLSYLDSRQRGDLLSRVTNDIDNVQTTLATTISQLLTAALTGMAVPVMMLTMSPLLAAITLVIVPMSLLVTRIVGRRSRRLFAAQWADTGRLNAHMEEIYSGFVLMKAFGQRSQAEEQTRDINTDVYRASFGAQLMAGLVPQAMMFISNLSYLAVAVVGALQVAAGQITLGSLQAFFQYIRLFNQPLIELSALYNVVQSGIASAERIFDLLDAPEQTPDTPIAPPSLNGQVRSGKVEFCHVDFSYRPGSPVMEDLSLVAEPGNTVAIVGPTGVGKTTLVNLLMRFYEVDSGRILLDGVDTTTVSRQALRSRIGMVLQDTWLFSGTIAENIAYGRTSASRDEIVAAAKSAYVDRFVHTLPDGYDTWVSDDDGNISAGEKQLITIARAFLARPHLLILDEATSSVDTRTEVLIQQAIRELRRDRTSFIIAHRLSTIRDADVILVMGGGRVVEHGSHAELMNRRGAYYAMTRAGNSEDSG